MNGSSPSVPRAPRHHVPPRASHHRRPRTARCKRRARTNRSNLHPPARSLERTVHLKRHKPAGRRPNVPSCATDPTGWNVRDKPAGTTRTSQVTRPAPERERRPRRYPRPCRRLHRHRRAMRRRPPRPEQSPLRLRTSDTGKTPAAQAEAEHSTAALASADASTATIADVTAVMLLAGLALFSAARANQPDRAREHDNADA